MCSRSHGALDRLLSRLTITCPALDHELGPFGVVVALQWIMKRSSCMYCVYSVCMRIFETNPGLWLIGVLCLSRIHVWIECLRNAAPKVAASEMKFWF